MPNLLHAQLPAEFARLVVASVVRVRVRRSAVTAFFPAQRLPRPAIKQRASPAAAPRVVRCPTAVPFLLCECFNRVIGPT